MLEAGGSTGQTVLTLLKTQGQLNAAELAEQLHLTEMAVRRHLSTLERDGLIRPMVIRQADEAKPWLPAY